MFKSIKTVLASVALTAGLVSPVLADEIVVGGKNFTEQQILSSITTQLLAEKGYEVDNRSGRVHSNFALRQPATAD